MKKFKNFQKTVSSKKKFWKEIFSEKFSPPLIEHLYFGKKIKKDFNNQKNSFFYLLRGFFLVFLKNILFEEFHSHEKQNFFEDQSKKKIFHFFEVIMELYYFNKQAFKSIKQKNFLRKIFLFCSRISNEFLFFNFEFYTIFFRNPKKIKKFSFNPELLFFIFYHRNNFGISNSLIWKQLIFRNLKKNNVQSFQQFCLLFFRNLKNFFYIAKAKKNKKRFMAVYLLKKIWDWNLGIGIKKGAQEKKKRFLEKGNQNSPSLKRLQRIIIQKNSDFLRDFSPSIKKETLEITFLISQFPGRLGEGLFLSQRLFFFLNQRKLISKINLKNFSLNDLKDKIFSKKGSIHFFFLKTFFFSNCRIEKIFFFFPETSTIEQRLIERKNLIQKTDQIYLIPKKKKKISAGLSRFSLCCLFLESFQKLKFSEFSYYSYFFKFLRNFLKETIRKNFLYSKKFKTLEIIGKFFYSEKITKRFFFLNLWISFLINASYHEITLLNSFFYQILKRRMDSKIIFKLVKKKSGEKLSHEKRFQQKIIFFILKITKNFEMKKPNYNRNNLTIAKKFFFMDKFFLIFWFESFSKEFKLLKLQEKKQNMISQSHGLLLLLFRSTLNSLRKENHYNSIIERKVVSMFFEISSNPAKIFSKIIEKFQKKEEFLEKKNNFSDFFKIFLFFPFFEKNQVKREKIFRKKKTIFWEKQKNKNYAPPRNWIMKRKQNFEKFQIFCFFFLKKWEQDPKDLKLFFLDLFQELQIFQNPIVQKVSYLFGFFFHIESEKETRLKLARNLWEIHLSTQNGLKSQAFGLANVFMDESSVILNKEILKFLDCIKNGALQLKKNSIVFTNPLKNFTFFLFIFKRTFLGFFNNRTSKQPRNNLDFIFPKNKEEKEKEIKEMLKIMDTMVLSFLSSIPRDLNERTLLRSSDTECEQRKKIIFLSWIICRIKEPRTIEKVILYSNLLPKNQMFFEDKIKINLEKKIS